MKFNYLYKNKTTWAKNINKKTRDQIIFLINGLN